MENLTNKQKTILVIMIGIMVLVIGYYIIQSRNSNFEILEDEILVEKDENKREKEEEKIIVHITGCVETEGIVELKEGARVQDAIDSAGGLTSDANIKNVNLAYILDDGQKIYIPSNIEGSDEEEQMPYVTGDVGSGVIKEDVVGGSSSQSGKVNINKATQTELETLSGIGPSTALKIIEYRNNNGKFDSIEDIKQVSGIGDAKFEQIKDSISVK